VANPSSAGYANRSFADEEAGRIMLETLDQVDWSQLGHAYGRATDVPEMLRALAAPDRARGEWAVEALAGSIGHQGTVYDATAPAVPFLIEILRNNVPLAREVVHLLGWLGQGTGDEADVRAAHLAVLDGVPHYLLLLEDPRPEVRGAVTFLLSICAERRAEVETALMRRIGREDEPKVRAALVVGLTRLWEAAGQAPPARGEASRQADFLTSLMATDDPPPSG
jgi:hypothetical protein